MGSGGEYKCRKCGFEFASLYGIGFCFFTSHIETIEKGKNGELGDELKEFFEKHEDGTIDSAYTVLCCEKCGNLENGKDLTMYIVQGNDKKEQVEYAKYPHKCKKCGGRMRIVGADEQLICPKCKIPLERLWDRYWD